MGNVARAGVRLGPILTAPLLAAVISLSACSSSSHSSSAASSSSSRPPSSAATGTTPTSTGGPAAENTGIKVTGAFDTKPTVTLPASQPPKQLIEQTLVAGHGTAVAAGDTVITNYVGEIWPAKAGSAPKVFDSSFARGAPTGFVIGAGAVIPGFDKTLVGKRMGTRVLLSVPPADGYGASGNSQAGISGTDTLVFVVDLLTDYKPNASAPGVADSQLPATGWPKITGTPGQQPHITSVAGVKTPTSPTSKLLVKGSGAKIDSRKNLVLQLVGTDIATGKQSQSTWGKQPQLASAQNVLSIATALNGQNVGARAVVLLPATPAQPASATATSQPATPAQVLIIDVVGQY
ncbi:MAG: FKBP-type peptidyl-prolyl cis-trans isomerase [Acidimicrobiaceae bacterium]|nr:FKBP-type peptidyl-prolyl cis-trans isomerase [Acidimicrobiaceae bacterium]